MPLKPAEPLVQQGHRAADVVAHVSLTANAVAISNAGPKFIS